MSLGHRIRYYRTKRGWTLEQLAEKSDVDIGTISALENRGSQRSQFAQAIAKAFGLSIEQLLDESRDWLEPEANAANVHRVLAQTQQPRYLVTQWLFSDELYQTLQHKKRHEIERVENLVRVHLQMPPLPARAGKARAA